MSTSRQDIESKLQRFIEEELLGGTQKISLEDELLMDGYVDSVGAMRLVAYIEKSFELTVPPEDFTIQNFGTISMLATYVGDKTR